MDWLEKVFGINGGYKIDGRLPSWWLYEKPKKLGDMLQITPDLRRDIEAKLRQLKAKRRFKNNRPISNIPLS